MQNLGNSIFKLQFDAVDPVLCGKSHNNFSVQADKGTQIMYVVILSATLPPVWRKKKKDTVNHYNKKANTKCNVTQNWKPHQDKAVLLTMTVSCMQQYNVETTLV